MNEIAFSELKSRARLQIKGNILMYFGTTFVLALIMSVASATVIGTILLSGAVELGSVCLALEIARRHKCQFNTGFKGFTQFGSAFIASWVSSIFILLWCCLLIIPGIVAAFRYAMTFYILADNPGMSGLEAISVSQKMMKGHKWEFFLLNLSFIGWLLLSILTCGILLIWLVPYMETTFALYYDALKQSQITIEEVQDGLHD